jgi:RecB family exonuclease
MRFLEEIARELLQKFPNGFDGVTVVLPSRRAALFLKKHLATQIRRPFFPPQMVTMTDLFTEFVPLRLAEPPELMFLLYEAYAEIENEDADTFDRYLRWGNMLLADFNDIDRYLVDPKAIFRDLRNIKKQELEIESWSFEDSQLSGNQEKYLQFWKGMKSYYDVFNRKLDERGWAYQGKLYRKVANEIAQIASGIRNRFFVFAGFNALSAAEEKIIDHLCTQGIGEIYFDVDQWYLEDQDHEAGLFFRRIRDKWGSRGFQLLGNHYTTGEKQIQIYNAPGNVAQARIAGEVLAMESHKAELKNIALVFADEQLLLPMLNSLPHEVDKANITMGFPLRNSDLFQLYLQLMQLYQARLDEEGKDKGGFYYKPFLDLMFHPLLREFMNKEEEDIRRQVSDGKRIFILDKYLNDFSGERFSQMRFLFEPVHDFPGEILNRFDRLNELLEHHFTTVGKSRLALEYIYHLSGVVKKLRDILHAFPYVRDFYALRTLLKQYVSQLDISFVGEPLDGLQIMGMLESRALDFDTIILTSANEELLPRSRWDHSFILFEVKRFHHLPTYKDRDALYANHFYRLLQRAKTIHIIYDADPDSFSSGEKSRFVQQIQEELPRINPKVHVDEVTVRLNLSASDLQHGVKKTEAIIARIREHLERGISPSALNTWLTCPMDYYYKYVLGLKEKEELDDVSDIAIAGNVIHKVLELQYEKFKGKELGKNDIVQMEKEMPSLLKEVLADEVGKSNAEQGTYYLIGQVADKFLRGFYTTEKESVVENTIEIVNLEEVLHTTKTFETRFGPVNFAIKGKADRIDRCNGVLRVIDYKTGSFNVGDVVLKDVQKLREKPKAMQLLAYSWALLFAKDYSETHVQSAIYPLKGGDEACVVAVGGVNRFGKDDIVVFEDVMRAVIEEMLDPDLPILHHADAMFCNMCN